MQVTVEKKRERKSHEVCCVSCGAFTSHKSSRCADCRRQKCATVECGVVFVPSRTLTVYCSKCDKARRKRARNYAYA